MSNTDQLVEQADRAAAGGDIGRARDLLGRAAQLGADDPAIHLKLAALHRASGEPKLALASVRQALVLAPRDFTALLMRASLLERLGDAEVGLAWDEAMAARPPGELPPHLAAAAEHGEKQWLQWLDLRERDMIARMATAEEMADEEQRRRMERFRTNTLHRTKVFHSNPTHFHYPELPEREFHPRRLFPWIEALEAATDTIAAELDALLHSERAELVPYVQYDDSLPLDQWKPLNNNRDWTAIHLLDRGKVVEANARHCPVTMDLLKSVPQPEIAGAGPNAMFSLLAPNTAIPPHAGVNNARLVCHLPLIVPDGCWFRVGAETRLWKRGELFVFDDTIEHEALNPSDQLRVVMIFDCWHPDLSDVERKAVAALIGGENTTGLPGA